jgi:predicted phage-related endonuclease
MHYMAVTGCKKAYLAVLVFGKGFYWFEIKRDENEIAALIDNEVTFWQTYVAQDRPPLADGSESSMDTLNRLYPNGDATTTHMVGMDEAMRNYIELGETIKRLKAQQDEVKAQLCQSLGSNSIGIGQDYSFSWKNQVSSRVDSKKLKELYPKVYEACVQQSESRVFRVKKNKKDK